MRHKSLKVRPQGMASDGEARGRERMDVRSNEFKRVAAENA